MPGLWWVDIPAILLYVFKLRKILGPSYPRVPWSGLQIAAMWFGGSILGMILFLLPGLLIHAAAEYAGLYDTVFDIASFPRVAWLLALAGRIFGGRICADMVIREKMENHYSIYRPQSTKRLSRIAD